MARAKTTFARDFLPREADCINYINADLIASGLSPFAPDKANIMAAKLMIQEIEKCVRDARSFAFENNPKRYLLCKENSAMETA